VLLDALEDAEFGLDHQALGVGGVHDALGDLDVLFERLVGGVDHDRAVDAALDAVHAGRFVAVVQVDGEHGVGEDLVGRLEHDLEHPFMRVRTSALGDLDDEGGLAAHVPLEKAHALLEIVDVVRPDGILAVGVLEKLFGVDDHVCLVPLC
jgi:hypothetical protein